MSDEKIDDLLILWLKDGSIMRCCAADEPALEAAVEAYLGVDQWKHAIVDRDDRDRLVSLSHLSGARIRVLTSSISGWMISSLESRERDVQQDAALEREKAAFTVASNPEKSCTAAETPSAPC